jgi:hypothetical protein
MVMNAGCRLRRSEKAFIPSESKARTALETALTAWKNSMPPGTIQTSSPAIEALDSQWRNGKKLESFEIVSSEKNQDLTWFSVKLQLKGEPQKEVKYVVIGIDPLNVFSEADYQQASGTM